MPRYYIDRDMEPEIRAWLRCRNGEVDLMLTQGTLEIAVGTLTAEGTLHLYNLFPPSCAKMKLQIDDAGKIIIT